MHTVIAKALLSSKNGMNIYRGCSHGCIYCDSRSKCYQMHHLFEDIEIKVNAPELLEEALRKKRKKCMIGTGSMTDPYIPLEETLMLTKRCLEIIDQYGFGVTLITKSAMVLRDLELFQSIHQKAKCVIQMTLTTYDEKLCKILEPNVSSTRERYEALKEFQKNHIPTVVWLTPILPFINDTEENIRGILNYCFDAGVKGIIVFGVGMTLREGNREYYYKKLDQYFPGLKETYIKIYQNDYIISSFEQNHLMKIIVEECKKHHVMYRPEEIFEYLTHLSKPSELQTEQLYLFEKETK